MRHLENIRRRVKINPTCARRRNSRLRPAKHCFEAVDADGRAAVGVAEITAVAGIGRAGVRAVDTIAGVARARLSSINCRRASTGAAVQTQDTVVDARAGIHTDNARAGVGRAGVGTINSIH